MNAASHNHAECLQGALQKADAVCQSRNVRLTTIRRRVLELVWNSHRAIKAYDILQRLNADDGARAPATVYRALDFLLAQGLLHKVQSMNAFIGCLHPLEHHDCQFFICDECGEVSECCDDQVARQIYDNAEKIGFRPAWQAIELHGTCAECQVS